MEEIQRVLMMSFVQVHYGGNSEGFNDVVFMPPSYFPDVCLNIRKSFNT